MGRRTPGPGSAHSMTARVWPARAVLAALVAVHVFQVASGAEPASVPEPAPAPYRDRIIDAASLPPLAPDEEDELDTAQGLPRSLRVEAIASVSERGDDALHEDGVA